jgi:hypothetical protein
MGAAEDEAQTSVARFTGLKYFCFVTQGFAALFSIMT